MPVALRDPQTQRLMANLTPLTPKQIRDAERDQVSIFNVSNREYRVQGPDKFYIIPACPEGEEVSEALVIPGFVYTTGVKRVHNIHAEYEWVAIDGVDVANDLVGTAPFKDQSEDLTRFGVFIARGEQPTMAELAEAKRKWFARCDEKIREADSYFAINNGMVDIGQGRMVSNIGPDHIAAAKIMGVERAWSRLNPKMESCPFCGVSCLPGVAFCPNGDIINEEKARMARPWLFAAPVQAQQAVDTIDEPRRGPGRPRRED